jgi:small subunit ribosomal protein S4e
MVSIAGSKKLKRQMAPNFWGITRKDKRFVITVKPGPHSKKFSIPTAVFLRDTLKIVSTLREAKSTIYDGKVTVDGIKRKSLHHGIGLMDVVELDGVSDIYRLVPQGSQILKQIKIEDAEKSKKLVKVISKTTIQKGKMQIGFHDGRSLISDTSVNVGDSCLIQIPEQKILDVIKLEKGSQVIVTQGVNAGQIGSIVDIKEGTFMLPKRVLVTLGEREIEIPTALVMLVGKDKPVIQIR